MVGQRWSAKGAYWFFIATRLVIASFSVVAGVRRHDPALVGIGVLAVLFVVRQFGVSLVLDAGHAVVRNPFRTYRVPYADIVGIDVSQTGRFGTGTGSMLGTTTRLLLETPSRSVVVEVTGWLSDADRWTIRETLLRLARDGEPGAVRTGETR